MRITNRRIAVAGSITIAVALGATMAVAYWTNTGSGFGTGTAGSVAANTLVIENVVVQPGIYPGGTATVSGTVRNTASTGSSIFFDTIRSSTTTAPIETTPPSCVPTDFHFATITIPAGQSLAPGGTYNFTTGSLSMDNTSVSQDSCQLATIKVNLEAVDA